MSTTTAAAPGLAGVLALHRSKAEERLRVARAALVVAAHDAFLLPSHREPTVRSIREGFPVDGRELTLAVDEARDALYEEELDGSDPVRIALDDVLFAEGWLRATLSIVGG
jgi:hypothetical protein